MTQERIKEICESWDVAPDGAALFNEDYVISTTGDLIGGINFSYLIADNQLILDMGWLNHLQEKLWYREEMFVPAYIEALCRCGVKEVDTKVKLYGENFILRPFEMRKDKELMNWFIEYLKVLRKFRGISIERLNKISKHKPFS